jgi:hypothetical protein
LSRHTESTLDGVFRNLFPSNEINYEQILNSLISKDKNIMLKSDIAEPELFSLLLLLGHYLKEIGFNVSSSLIYFYAHTLLKAWVSKKRLSRGEVIEGLKGLLAYAEKMQEQQQGQGLMRRY